MGDQAGNPELFPEPDASKYFARLREMLAAPRPFRTPSHDQARVPCAGCGEEILLAQAAALVPRGTNYEPVCFACRDVTRMSRVTGAAKGVG